MTELTRASLSIERSLMERFDRAIEEGGHSNRSEAMRDLIRAHLQSLSWGESPRVAATVTLIYDHHARRLTRQIEEHGHEHHGVTLSSMHIHLSADLCLEVVILCGGAREVREAAQHLVGLQGVLHGGVVYSDLEGAHAHAHAHAHEHSHAHTHTHAVKAEGGEA